MLLLEKDTYRKQDKKHVFLLIKMKVFANTVKYANYGIPLLILPYGQKPDTHAQQAKYVFFKVSIIFK